MSNHITRLLLVLVCAMSASCAGYHSMPPVNYSSVSAANDRVLKIVFDQDGDPYPRSDGAVPIPAQVPNRDLPFSIAEHYKEAKIAYNREAILDDFASTIAERQSRNPAARLVFLIKGFNNSYQSSDHEYAFVRQFIHDLDPTSDHLFVQVYWDAIFKGPSTAPAPLAYFGEALTYSNLAGQCGLRSLIERLPDGTKATFLTHSRGAAVAVSSVADPLYDKDIVRCKSTPLTRGKLSDTVLVAFAPAIGSGHMGYQGQPRDDVYTHVDRFYAGFNANDEATSKTAFGIRIGPSRGGDTSLAASDPYFTAIANASSGRLQREIFNQAQHSWGAYLDDDRATRCLLWAGRLIAQKPTSCTVSR